MKLSENFTLKEAVKSSTAERLGIDNTPTPDIIENLKLTASNILQPVRDHYGIAFSPSSFYRCLKLNRVLKSKDTSQHVFGEAVDFEVPGIDDNLTLVHWCKDNLDFDKLILECYKPEDPESGWIHASYRENNNRGEIYTMSKDNGHWVTVKGLP